MCHHPEAHALQIHAPRGPSSPPGNTRAASAAATRCAATAIDRAVQQGCAVAILDPLQPRHDAIRVLASFDHLPWSGSPVRPRRLQLRYCSSSRADPCRLCTCIHPLTPYGRADAPELEPIFRSHRAMAWPARLRRAYRNQAAPASDTSRRAAHAIGLLGALADPVFDARDIELAASVRPCARSG